jgi:MinD-like ATPase involved in chromosome partitioning or flagellar assembly
LDNSDQDQPVESGPAQPRSVWADMVISGPEDEDEPEPEPAAGPGPEGEPSWPASGLPPSFGQRATEGERPGAARPGPGSGYGGYRPLGSLPPGGPVRGGAPWEEPGGRRPEPGPEPHAEYGPEPGAEYGPEPESPAGPAPGTTGPGPDLPAPYGPWETYETGESYGWTGEYGVVPEPRDRQDGAGRATAYGSNTGHPGAAGYGTVAPDQEAAAEGVEPPGWQAESADSLTADLLLRGRHAAPPSGWRRALYQVTGGLVRAPQSAADRRRKDLVLRARTPVAGGHHRVAVLSLKGGVGKTTTTVGLGATLASLRGDRIIAVDANPDRGTLSDKLRLETAATVRDLLNEEDQIQRYADVRAYTTQSPSGLEVLASDRDPTVSVAFSDSDYEDVAQVLEHYYSVSITDCGTGLLHSAMAGVLRLADQIVLVSSPSVDGARSASATLDWLAAHQYGDLVRGAVVVLSAIRPRSKSGVDLARLEQHFAARCRAVVRIPYDGHLEEGAEVDLAQLSRATADAYLVLAAEVGDGFSWPRH